MKHAELLDENCAIARSSGIVGERWVWVILRQAFNGARRFEDFQRGIGLARNVLTDRLNWLVDHGILERRPYAEHAARDLNEYRLTAKGRRTVPRLHRAHAMGQRLDRPPRPARRAACEGHPARQPASCRDDDTNDPRGS